MELDHLGIAVPNLAEAVPLWTGALGLSASAPEEVPSQKVRVAFLTVGGTHLELLEPTDPEATIARFLADRGPGLHHVAFHVPSVNAMLTAVEQRGFRLIDRVARPGARGRRVGFVHPKSFGGVLVEFVEGP